MQVVVKMPHTDPITVIGETIPEDLIKFLESKGSVTITDDDEEYVNIEETEWFQKMKSERTPGKALRTYRERDGLTLVELGEKLGGVPRQNVSAMENDRRTITKDTAMKLGEIFGTSYKRFL